MFSLTLRGPFLQTSEEGHCELEPWVTVNTSDTLRDRGLVSFHLLFTAAVLREEWEAARFPDRVILSVHSFLLHVIFLHHALSQSYIWRLWQRTERREPGWVVLQQFLTDTRVCQSSWYRLRQCLGCFHLWKGWASKEVASG